MAALLLAGASSASAANWFEMNFWLKGPTYSARLPSCDNPHALAEIQARFQHKEYKFWKSDLLLVNFEKVHETAFRPWAEGTIPRRFCTARVLVSDGIWRPVHYSIAEDLAEIGMSWGVEWCVVGLDRNWSYNPACRMARP